jgi:hypothetical protein
MSSDRKSRTACTAYNGMLLIVRVCLLASHSTAVLLPRLATLRLCNRKAEQVVTGQITFCATVFVLLNNSCTLLTLCVQRRMLFWTVVLSKAFAERVYSTTVPAPPTIRCRKKSRGHKHEHISRVSQFSF